VDMSSRSSLFVSLVVGVCFCVKFASLCNISDGVWRVPLRGVYIDLLSMICESRFPGRDELHINKPTATTRRIPTFFIAHNIYTVYHRAMPTTRNSASLVTTHNSLPVSSLSQFLPSPPPNLPANLTTALYTSDAIPAATFTACFDLISDNMMLMYRRSSLRWSSPHKKKEMRHPAMRFLVLSRTTTTTSGGDGGASDGGKTERSDGGGDWEESDREGGEVLGFTSFMVTEENDREVIYCYELQLVPEAQGNGYGKVLMTMLEGFGRNVGLTMAMLTVFTENTGAIRFYQRIGYDKDVWSPKPRQLRNGEVREPDYFIFSKQI